MFFMFNRFFNSRRGSEDFKCFKSTRADGYIPACIITVCVCMVLSVTLSFISAVTAVNQSKGDVRQALDGFVTHKSIEIYNGVKNYSEFAETLDEESFESILKAKYKPPEKNYYDAAEKILIGIDMDIPRMETAAEYGVHIFLLDWQVNAVKEILRGKRAVLHPITTDIAEEILRLPSELYVKETKPYITEKGEFLSAPV